MARTDRLSERIGAVFIPEPDAVPAGDEDLDLGPEEDLIPGAEPPAPIDPDLELLDWDADRRRPRPATCRTSLKQGCYTVSFVPKGAPVLGNRFRGTMRVERRARGVRFSGDLYRYRLLDDLVVDWPRPVVGLQGLERASVPTDEAADTPGTIPIYPRASYRSYLKGTKARLVSRKRLGVACSFTLEMDEFVYDHPAAGFSGSFDPAPTRSIRWVMQRTSTPHLYSGEAFDGATSLGTVSMRWVSGFYRRAAVQLNTLKGAESPPTVDGATIASIFADAGWDVTFTDGGTIDLPPALSSVAVNACWDKGDLHALMTSAPGYDPADLDTVWRVHLVAVPAKIGCSRGVMFDSSLGADPNEIPREGSATFSRDGYPASETPHYDAAAGKQQRNVPRAYLRSATHEVGHAFNQIHQGFEAGNDNSIMTPTPAVADALGTAGVFPDGIALAFNDTVKRHLRHQPDPTVRPGAMDFFGAAVAAPEPADVAWIETAELALEVSSRRVRLGQPVTLRYRLSNQGRMPLAVPETLDTESLTVRVNVADPTGRITFMRPEAVTSCPRITTEELGPDSSREGEVTLFWGRDGFAFETPGRHVVEVIVLWKVGGVPVAASGEQDVFVDYPVSDADNEVAALMLDPEVGRAVAAGDLSAFAGASERVERAAKAAGEHPALEALAAMGMRTPPKGRRGATRKRA
jgi:hypothetical protein